MFIQASPREVFLEHEVARLKSENEYLKRVNQGALLYSVMEPPETIAVPKAVGSTLKLAAEIRPEYKEGHLHVLVRECGYPSNLNLSYFVSDHDILDSRDRTALLGEMHRRVIQDIAEKHFI